MSVVLKKGYSGPEYYRWYDWAFKYASSYNFLLGPRDGYFGDGEDKFVRELQKRGGLVVDGIFGDRTAAKFGYKFTGQNAPPVVQPRRKIWIFTFPGSGAKWWQGPSFELGNWCRDRLNLNHQPVDFQMGGYLGFMGGDSKFSYNEVIWDQCKSLESLLDSNQDVQEALRKAQEIIGEHDPNELTNAELGIIAKQLEFEMHLSGYSQSAEGAEEAAEWLFGDPGFVHPGDKSDKPSTGKYRLLRHCLKLVVQFGNPSTAVTGIARDKRPTWLQDKIRNVNKPNDFYAVVPASDKIRPAFYAVIVEAEMELPFFVQVLRIAVPIILKWLPFAAVFGPVGQMAIAATAGIDPNGPILGKFLGEAGTGKDQEVTNKLIEILTPMGLLSSLPALVGLIAALPGLTAHGQYGPADVDQAFNYIDKFRR